MKIRGNRSKCPDLTPESVPTTRMISQGEDSVLLVRAFISRTDRSGWLNNLNLLAGVRPRL